MKNYTITMKTILSLFLCFGVATAISAQCVKGNCFKGHGTYEWENGDFYEGMWKNGKPDGLGGLSAVLLSFTEIYKWIALPDSYGITVVIVLISSLFIGSVAFTGSLLAFAKLDGYRWSEKLTQPFQHIVNIIFLSFAAGYAEYLDIEDIYIGVNSVDYSGYPDCREEFIKIFEELGIEVLEPFDRTKYYVKFFQN